MPVYLVQCHLADDVRNLPELDAALEAADACVKPFPGTWIIEDALSLRQLRTMIDPHLRPGDGVIVVPIGPNASWSNVAAEAEAWMVQGLKKDPP